MSTIINLTSDDELVKTPFYQKIANIITQLYSSGVLFRIQKNCISGSEIIQKSLEAVGIKSRSIECTVTLINQNQEFAFVGFDDVSFEGEIDTHVVVVTNTIPQILIDTSIARYLPDNHPVVIEAINSTDPDVISEFNIQGVKITYNIKKNIKLPHLHQQTLIERYNYEKTTSRNIKILKYIIFSAIFLGCLNLFFNSWAILMRQEGSIERETISIQIKELKEHLDKLERGK